MFLADAVAAYVTSLTEREFDAPLIALLRSRGFTHVHLIHGQYEFGKDIIAHRLEEGVEHQYCIQSKAGNLNVQAWRAVRLQVDAMRTGTVAHPDFDPTLPRRLVVATNGRLVGGAGVEFQDYNSHHAERGEVAVDSWDIDTLAPWFYEILIDGVSAQQRSRTLELLGQLSSGRGTTTLIRDYAATWYQQVLPPRERWGNVLTSAMLARHALEAGREDLAIQVACHLIRVTHEVSDLADAAPQRRVARALIADVATRTWHRVRPMTPTEFVHHSLDRAPAFSAFITHPVKVARLCEALSLGALLHVLEPDAFSSADGNAISDFSPREVAAWIRGLLNETPALSHPVGDDYAFSLLVTCLLLSTSGYDVTEVLRDAAVWLLDRVEFADGIAETGATARTVTCQLLASPYPRLRSPGRDDSYALTVVIDLARLLGFSSLYDDLVHDLDAVEAHATIVRGYPPEAATLIARLSYAQDATDPSRPVAAHYLDDSDVMAAGKESKWFDVLATWASLRDRHTPSLLHSILDAAGRGLAPADPSSPAASPPDLLAGKPPTAATD